MSTPFITDERRAPPPNHRMGLSALVLRGKIVAKRHGQMDGLNLESAETENIRFDGEAPGLSSPHAYIAQCCVLIGDWLEAVQAESQLVDPFSRAPHREYPSKSPV